MNVLPFKKQLQIVNALVEGNSIRATSRIVGVEHKTVMRVLLRVGDACGRLLNERVRHLHAKRIQVDEIWTYLLLKEKHKTAEHPPETGDQYVFVAMDSDTKLVISHLVGKRDYPNAFNLMADLKTRLDNRVQLTTDGFRPFLMAVEDNFGSDIDYGVLVKMYGGDRAESAGPAWYGPAKVVSAMPTRVMGDPDWKHISTSHIERQNLTMRMQMRRFTRLTNAASKKLDNLKAQVALHFAHYNFCRVHYTLRVTPAMESGLASTVWTLADLLTAGRREWAA
jgi:IS1 family transposase